MRFLDLVRFVVAPILLTTFGEFLLKAMMTRPVEDRFHLFLNPWVFLAFFAIIFGGILWLYAMSKLTLSFIYPFMSLNYIIIILGSDIGFQESVGWHRYVAVLFIIIGLLILSRSSNSRIE